MELTSSDTKPNEVQELPNGRANDSTEEFKKIVDESRQKIASEVPTAVKRGRGRPRKVRPDSVSQSIQSGPRPPSVATETPKTPPPDISRYLETPIISLSKLPAVKYEIPELQFDENEAKACAESLNQVLQAFVPSVGEMSPKTAAVVSAFATFGSIGFSKYQIYLDKRKHVEPVQTEVQTENAELQNGIFPVHAADIFRRP